jgi:hypothetical protein
MCVGIKWWTFRASTFYQPRRHVPTGVPYITTRNISNALTICIIPSHNVCLKLSPQTYLLISIITINLVVLWRLSTRGTRSFSKTQQPYQDWQPPHSRVLRESLNIKVYVAHTHIRRCGCDCREVFVHTWQDNICHAKYSRFGAEGQLRVSLQELDATRVAMPNRHHYAVPNISTDNEPSRDRGPSPDANPAPTRCGGGDHPPPTPTLLPRPIRSPPTRQNTDTNPNPTALPTNISSPQQHGGRQPERGQFYLDRQGLIEAVTHKFDILERYREKGGEFWLKNAMAAVERDRVLDMYRALKRRLDMIVRDLEAEPKDLEDGFWSRQAVDGEGGGDGASVSVGDGGVSLEVNLGQGVGVCLCDVGLEGEGETGSGSE